MNDSARLPLHGELERGPTLALTVDGRPIEAFAGETVAGVLFAEGVAATRHTRRGEARGVYCGMGVCFDCLVVIDGVPNTRACMTWVTAGMRVERQDGLVAVTPGSPFSSG